MTLPFDVPELYPPHTKGGKPTSSIYSTTVMYALPNQLDIIVVQFIHMHGVIKGTPMCLIDHWNMESTL